jgi:hypothetical protein
MSTFLDRSFRSGRRSRTRLRAPHPLIVPRASEGRCLPPHAGLPIGRLNWTAGLLVHPPESRKPTFQSARKVARLLIFLRSRWRMRSPGHDQGRAASAETSLFPQRCRQADRRSQCDHPVLVDGQTQGEVLLSIMDIAAVLLTVCCWSSWSASIRRPLRCSSLGASPRILSGRNIRGDSAGGPHKDAVRQQNISFRMVAEGELRIWP